MHMLLDNTGAGMPLRVNAGHHAEQQQVQVCAEPSSNSHPSSNQPHPTQPPSPHPPILHNYTVTVSDTVSGKTQLPQLLSKPPHKEHPTSA
jgi:hypothetical protein